MPENPAPPPGAFGGWRWHELPDSGQVRISALLYECLVPRNPDQRADSYLRGHGFTHLVNDADAPNTVVGFCYERGRWWRYPLHADVATSPVESPRLATERIIAAITAPAARPSAPEVGP